MEGDVDKGGFADLDCLLRTGLACGRGGGAIGLCGACGLGALDILACELEFGVKGLLTKLLACICRFGCGFPIMLGLTLGF